MTGKIEQAVNDHVLDHLVNGPVAHRALMDAALAGDAEIEALTRRNAELTAFADRLLRAVQHTLATSSHTFGGCVMCVDAGEAMREYDESCALTPTESEAK